MREGKNKPNLPLTLTKLENQRLLRVVLSSLFTTDHCIKTDENKTGNTDIIILIYISVSFLQLKLLTLTKKTTVHSKISSIFFEKVKI
jgi:hypothetical protein